MSVARKFSTSPPELLPASRSKISLPSTLNLSLRLMFMNIFILTRAMKKFYPCARRSRENFGSRHQCPTFRSATTAAIQMISRPKFRDSPAKIAVHKKNFAENCIVCLVVKFLHFNETRCHNSANYRAAKCRMCIRHHRRIARRRDNDWLQRPN